MRRFRFLYDGRNPSVRRYTNEQISACYEIIEKYSPSDPSLWSAIRKQVTLIITSKHRPLSRTEHEMMQEDLGYILARTYESPADHQALEPLYGLLNQHIAYNSRVFRK